MAEKENNPLVTKLFDALKKRKVSVAKFAVEARIPKARVYKWPIDKTNPKVEDVEKINTWLSGKKVEKTPLPYKINHELPPATGERDEFLNLYIDSLLEQKKILEVQNDFLRRNFETSLTMINEEQHRANNQLKALGWYQALVASAGDEKKADAEMARIGNKAAWYAGLTQEADKSGGTGKKHKSR